MHRKTISLKLSENLDAKLNRLVKIRKQTKLEIVPEAIELMLNGGEPKHPVSMAELAGDLAGRLEGPGDLSINPKCMEGYGRRGAHPIAGYWPAGCLSRSARRLPPLGARAFCQYLLASAHLRIGDFRSVFFDTRDSFRE